MKCDSLASDQMMTRGVAVVVIHHGRGGRQRGGEIGRAVQRAANPAERGFDFHIHPEAVCGVQQLGGRRVVRGADVVQVRFLQQADIRLGMARGVGAARQRVDLMVASAGEFDPLAVDVELPAADLDVAETDVPFDALQDSPARSQLQAQSVKLRLLRAPLQWRSDVRDEVNGLRAGERPDACNRERVANCLAARVAQLDGERQVLLLCSARSPARGAASPRRPKRDISDSPERPGGCFARIRDVPVFGRRAAFTCNSRTCVGGNAKTRTERSMPPRL